MSSWPFALTIYFAKTIYILINFKLKNIEYEKILLLFFLILISYILINHDYLIYHLNRTEHYTNLEISFFYSFHFRSFFGSIPMGGLMILLFGVLFLKDLKRNLYSEDNVNILLYVIFSTYFLVIAYSILRAGVISPKYVIFILPLIIIWISHKITLIRIGRELIILIIFSNIVNTYLYFFENPIDRPPIKRVINHISSDGTNLLVMNEGKVFVNAFSNYKSFKDKKLRIVNLRESKIDIDTFWFVCLNNARFAIGDKILPTEEKCKIIEKYDDFKTIETFEIEDFYIKKYSKIN